MLNKKKKRLELKAVVNGKCIPIEETKDEVFSNKVLGEGIAFLPADGKIVAPVAGAVSKISPEKHLYCIQTKEGVNVVVHIGIGSVRQNGEGFVPMVSEGQKVQAGDMLADVDIDCLKAAGVDLCTPVIVTGHDILDEIECETGDVTAGESIVMRFTMK